MREHQQVVKGSLLFYPLSGYFTSIQEVNRKFVVDVFKGRLPPGKIGTHKVVQGLQKNLAEIPGLKQSGLKDMYLKAVAGDSGVLVEGRLERSGADNGTCIG